MQMNLKDILAGLVDISRDQNKANGLAMFLVTALLGEVLRQSSEPKAAAARIRASLSPHEDIVGKEALASIFAILDAVPDRPHTPADKA